MLLEAHEECLLDEVRARIRDEHHLDQRCLADDGRDPDRTERDRGERDDGDVPRAPLLLREPLPEHRIDDGPGPLGVAAFHRGGDEEEDRRKKLATLGRRKLPRGFSLLGFVLSRRCGADRPLIEIHPRGVGKFDDRRGYAADDEENCERDEKRGPTTVRELPAEHGCGLGSAALGRLGHG